MKLQYVTMIAVAMLAACNNNTGKPAPIAGERKASTMHASPDGSDYADSVNQGAIQTDTMAGSPLRAAMANIGKVHVHIEYSAPGVKGRTIWGNLVPYGQVWASGANQATAIDFSGDVVIRERSIAAGTYALFTIPGQNEWIVILNKRFTQHLTDEYDQNEDVARFVVKPLSLDTPVRRLTYSVVPESDSTGNVILSWDRLQIMLPVAAGAG
ncbi:DUF2911 domain-containing protein [Chitinophaga sp.]|uniref:DUF2911 domain-containing protein n=1 Tax=Chitinophaga sp. TaxID=1869181 RepID=UPI002F9452A0